MKLFDGSETHQMHIYGTKKSTAGTPVYISLAILVFFLWIFDTETWLQRTLLLSLALALTLFFSPMFGSRKEERGKENTTQQNADGTSEPAGDNGSPAKKERRVYSERTLSRGNHFRFSMTDLSKSKLEAE